MPRTKRKLNGEEEISKDTVEAKPRRRLKQHNSDSTSKIKETKAQLKKSFSKYADKNSNPYLNEQDKTHKTSLKDFEKNSPQATDSGISSESNHKEEIDEGNVSKILMKSKCLRKSTQVIKNLVQNKTEEKSISKRKLRNLTKLSIQKKKSVDKIGNCLTGESSESACEQDNKDFVVDSSSRKKRKSERRLKTTKRSSKYILQSDAEIEKNIKNETSSSEDEFISTDLANGDTSCSKDETAMQVLTRLEFESLNNENLINLKTESQNTSDKESSSGSDWEEVEESTEQTLDDYNPEIPKDGVEITIEVPELSRKRKKKQFDHMEYIRLHVNRQRKEIQLNMHKTHLLCLLAHGFYLNDILNSSLLKGLSMSVIPTDITKLTSGKKIDSVNLQDITNIVKWFCEFFDYERQDMKQPFVDFQKKIPEYFTSKYALNPSEYNLIFIVIARMLGFKTRLCLPLYPITYKATNLLKKPGSSNNKKSKTTANETESTEIISKNDNKTDKSEKLSKSTGRKKTKKSSAVKEKKSSSSDLSTMEKKNISNKKEEKKSHLRKSAKKNYKIDSDDCSDENDSDFEDPEIVVRKTKTPSKIPATKSKIISNRKVLSSDSAPSSPENAAFSADKIFCWAEIFCKAEKCWITVDSCNANVNRPADLEKIIIQPVAYIVAIDNSSRVKDVTRRYCSDYMTSTIKLRADPEWWEETLEPFAPLQSKLDKEEEKKLEETLINKPLPQTVSAFKNHPLYALKRHLLKFEGIYPPDAAPVGFLRSEAIYARENVCKLHSRETWVKEARVVRPGEEPYKIVKARPKWDRIAGIMKTDLPLDIFGFWQTDPYEPPIAVGGKVPRNEYGNVELFKPCMLPKGTVHLQIPGLNRIAKKLEIDCSPAVIGFDGHKGSIHPVFDGFVVCKEFKDTLLAAWDEEQENARKREVEKREKRIYGNWKKLIKGLLIRERIKLKYDVK